jgi:hypothetical protein
MLSEGDVVYLGLTSESRKANLQPGKVVDANLTALTVEITEDACAREQNQEILIYYNQRRDFVKQWALVNAVMETPSDENGQSKILVEMVRLGEPVSAENRECFRVSTTIEELTASFGDCEDCQVMDVSPTGFSLISVDEHEIGDIVTATIQYDGVQYSGSTRVQSKRILRDGRVRYGLHCIDKAYREAVQQLVMEVQH